MIDNELNVKPGTPLNMEVFVFFRAFVFGTLLNMEVEQNEHHTQTVREAVCTCIL